MARRERELKVVILGDASGARRAMASLESAGAGMGDKMVQIGKRAAQAFALVGAGASAAIFKVGTDYQDSLNVFQSVSRATGSTMEQVRAKAKELGADMSLPATSAADAAAAMTELVKAGLSVNDTLAASKGVLQLAAAAQITEAEAATITANALNSFGLKGTDAIKVADLLAAAANASSGEITDVGMAFSQASAVFAAAKVPIDDVTASIGLMANKGIIGSDAGTSLRSMLLKLQSPSKEAAGTMSDLGVKVYDAQGRMKSMRDIIGQFTAKTKNLTQEQRDNALATIFGSDAVRAANIVLTGGIDTFDKMKVAVNREGAASEVAAAKTKGLKGAIEGMKSQLETVAITIFEKVAPSIEKFVRKVAENIPKVVAWFEKRLAPALDKVAGFVSTKVVPAMQKFAGYITETVLPALKGAWEFLRDRFLSAFNRVRDALRDNREGLKELADFITTRVLPALIVIAGVLVETLGLALTGTIIILGQVTKAWDFVVEAMRTVVAFIADKVLAAFEWIVTAAANAFGWVPGLGPKLREAAKDMEKFRDDVNASLDGVKDKTVAINFDSRIPSALMPGQPGYIPPLRPGEAGPPAPGQGRQAGPVVNSYNTTVNVQTNAPPEAIAREVGWRRRGWGR